MGRNRLSPHYLYVMDYLSSMSTKAKFLSGFIVLLTTAVAWLNKKLWVPSRAYDRESNSVGREYDAWTEDGILEHYWGEHIHLGWYNEAEMSAGYKKKDFIQAKYDFIDEMMKW